MARVEYHNDCGIATPPGFEADALDAGRRDLESYEDAVSGVVTLVEDVNARIVVDDTMQWSCGQGYPADAVCLRLDYFKKDGTMVETTDVVCVDGYRVVEKS